MSVAAVLSTHQMPTVSATVPSALSVEGVTVGYEAAHPILKDLNLSIPQGSCWAIVGPSGSGKTTLLRTLLGLLPPVQGKVSRAGVDAASTGRARIGYIPQNLGLVRNVSVRQNVLLGALTRLPWWQAVLGRFPADERKAAEEALALVGLSGRGDERIETMSGGERRRVAIARALLQRPHLLLADEFLAELDKNTAQEIEALLQMLREKTGVTILFVDHDIEAACRIADRVVVLVEGRKVCELDACNADPQDILGMFREKCAA